MKAQSRIAYLLVLALLAGLVVPQTSLAVIVDDASVVTEGDAAVSIGAAVAPAGFDATITVWSDSEVLEFAADPVGGPSQSAPRRITLTVRSSHPYALRVASKGDLKASGDVASTAGALLSPSIVRFARYGSVAWQPLSSIATTIAEVPKVAGAIERTYSFVFEAFGNAAPTWDIAGGGYRTDIAFDVVPLSQSTSAGTLLIQPGSDLPVAATPQLTDTGEQAITLEVTTPESTAGPTAEQPAPLPLLALDGSVAATLSTDPGAAERATLWLAGAALVPTSAPIPFSEFGAYRLSLTVDAAVVATLEPTPDSSAYVCNFDASGIAEGEHVVGVLAKTYDEDPGFVCWTAAVSVLKPVAAVPLSLPGDTYQELPAGAPLPSALEGSTTPVAALPPGYQDLTQTAASGGAAG